MRKEIGYKTFTMLSAEELDEYYVSIENVVIGQVGTIEFSAISDPDEWKVEMDGRPKY